MDGKKKCFLKVLARECDCTNYRVFSAEDFCECLSLGEDEEGCTAEEIYSYLKEFERLGFIAVKYAFNGMYCVLALPALSEFLEREESEKDSVCALEEEQKRAKKRSEKLLFWGGFSGAACGAVLLEIIRQIALK